MMGMNNASYVLKVYYFSLLLVGGYCKRHIVLFIFLSVVEKVFICVRKVYIYRLKLP